MENTYIRVHFESKYLTRGSKNPYELATENKRISVGSLIENLKANGHIEKEPRLDYAIYNVRFNNETKIKLYNILDIIEAPNGANVHITVAKLSK